jgi:hypothetical protein
MIMKSVVALIVVLVLAIVATSHAADPNATLTKVAIRFTTHNDNKDYNTRLNVTVKNRTTLFLSQDIAEAIDLAHDQEFVDPSTHNFELPLKGSIR